MIWERTCLPALYLGVVQRILEQAIAFVNKRQSGGKPLAAYQAISHPLAEIGTKLHVSRLLVKNAAETIDNQIDATRVSSMCKLFVSDFYKSSMVHFHQIFAGEAFRGYNDIERHLRDSMASTIYSGTTEIQKNMIAKSLGLMSRERV